MQFKVDERYKWADENLGSLVLRKAAPGRGSEGHGLPEAAHPSSHAVVSRLLVAGQEQWPVSDGAIDFEPVHAAINRGAKGVVMPNQRAERGLDLRRRSGDPHSTAASSTCLARLAPAAASRRCR